MMTDRRAPAGWFERLTAGGPVPQYLDALFQLPTRTLGTLAKFADNEAGRALLAAWGMMTDDENCPAINPAAVKSLDPDLYAMRHYPEILALPLSAKQDLEHLLIGRNCSLTLFTLSKLADIDRKKATEGDDES